MNRRLKILIASLLSLLLLMILWLVSPENEVEVVFKEVSPRIVDVEFKAELQGLSDNGQEVIWYLDDKEIGAGATVAFKPSSESHKLYAQIEQGSSAQLRYETTLSFAHARHSKLKLHLIAQHSVAPTSVKIKVLDALGEDVTSQGSAVNFRVPESWQLQDNGSYLVVKAGNYPVTAVVDNEFYTVELNSALVVDEVPELSVKIDALLKSERNREPALYSFKANVEGLHPEEAVKTVIWNFGDREYETSEVSRSLMHGITDLSVYVKSEMDRVGVARAKIKVAKNQLPECLITSEPTLTAVTFFADCEDQDGEIVNIDWIVNGFKTGYKTERLTITKELGGAISSVKVAVTDDSYRTVEFEY